MAYITWSDSFNTTIDEIDNQHRQIVDYINKLDDARQSGDRTAITQIIDGLTDYTISHFAFEECLMEDAGYSFVKPHQSIHQAFIKRISSFKDRFKAGEEIGEELQNLLKVWLIQHIQRDDAAYVKAVKPKMMQLLESKDEEGGSKGGWLARSMKKFFGK
ncbi:MAG: bacteriohemerythrin [bacterium]|nr:bacteriohemerythrin [bacterium]